MVTTATSDFHYEATILPLLLRAKKLILEKLASLRSTDEIEGLSDLIEGVSNHSVKERLETELNALRTEADESQRQIADLQEEQGREIDRLNTRNTELSAGLALSETFLRRYKFALSVAIALMGVFSVYWLPELLKWQWLLQHTKKTALQLNGIAFFIGVSWIVADSNSKRRLFVLASLVVAAMLAAIQLV